MAWIKERPTAYPYNFLPPHTDQFYATDIPMYYDEDHRFNIDRALSKEDVLKQSSSYPHLDTSKVSFDDLGWDRAAEYMPSIDQSTLNLKYIDPQNITANNLKSLGHETMHQTFDEEHGIPAAANLLKGSIEPYGEHFGTKNEGPKRATDYNPDFNHPEDRLKSEHLLIDAIQNMDYPETFKHSPEDSLYQGPWQRYHNALLDEVSNTDESELYDSHGRYLYYPPKWAEGFNAPGEVRRGYFGLKDLFDRSALKYKNILENYNKMGRLGPKAQQQRSPDEGLGDAGIAERIAAQDRAKKNAAIQEAVNIQIGRSRGDGGGQRGSMPTGTAGRNPWGRAYGGLIDLYRYGGFI